MGEKVGETMHTQVASNLAMVVVKPPIFTMFANLVVEVVGQKVAKH